MGRVLRLSEAVSNQIAAGEVVERPASVVKELVENAIDAGSSRIVVELAGSGTDLLRVTDDGSGMTREDAELAVERHATSKIRDALDLHAIATLGFRGEALPSIASVSRFSLVTRTRDSSEGVRVAIDGGGRPEVTAVGAAPGTVVEVRDLFFNVPARRKFLKSAATETGHVTETLARLALARPDIAFRLVQDDRTTLDVAPAIPGDPRGRLGRILGRSVAERLFPVMEDGRAHPVCVRGFLGSPELSERTTRGLHVFVNGRYVRDRTIQHAIQDAYRTLLERGRYPVAVLAIAIDPSRVDVNVHPQKTEVRFADSGEVHRAVHGALTRTLAAQPWLAGTAFPGDTGVVRYALRTSESSSSGAPDLASDRLGARNGSGFDEHRSRVEGALRERGQNGEDRGHGWTGLGGPLEEGFGHALVARDLDPLEIEDRAPGPREAVQLESEVIGGRFGSLEPVGQVMATYLVCQAPGRMVIIDQHAAHERIAFERMRRGARSRNIESQPLLVPLALELDAVRAEIAREEGTRLGAIGIEIEPFGGRTWLVKSRPRAIGSADLEKLVLDLLDELQEVGETTPFEEVVEGLLSCAACHTVVRAGDRLTATEVKALLRQMDEIDFGAHCPHGRPVFVEWTERELAALFHRT